MDDNLINKVNENIAEATKAEREHCCKRCGFDQTLQFVHADPELLKEYLKAAITQTPFSHTYQLFGGSLVATFEEPSGNLLRLQELAALHRVKGDSATISDSMDFAMLPALALVTMNSPETGTKIIYKASLERREQMLTDFELPEELKKMSLIMLQALRNTYGEFSQLIAQLVVEAQDENFWKGVGRN